MKNRLFLRKHFFQSLCRNEDVRLVRRLRCRSEAKRPNVLRRFRGFVTRANIIRSLPFYQIWSLGLNAPLQDYRRMQVRVIGSLSGNIHSVSERPTLRPCIYLNAFLCRGYSPASSLWIPSLAPLFSRLCGYSNDPLSDFLSDRRPTSFWSIGSRTSPALMRIFLYKLMRY